MIDSLSSEARVVSILDGMVSILDEPVSILTELVSILDEPLDVVLSILVDSRGPVVNVAKVAMGSVSV